MTFSNVAQTACLHLSNIYKKRTAILMLTIAYFSTGCFFKFHSISDPRSTLNCIELLSLYLEVWTSEKFYCRVLKNHDALQWVNTIQYILKGFLHSTSTLRPVFRIRVRIDMALLDPGPDLDPAARKFTKIR